MYIYVFVKRIYSHTVMNNHTSASQKGGTKIHFSRYSRTQ